jgi:CBS domain-containing protein
MGEWLLPIDFELATVLRFVGGVEHRRLGPSPGSYFGTCRAFGAGKGYVRREAPSPKTGRPAIAETPNTAGAIMTKDVVSVLVGTSVRDVAILLLEKRISAIPVLAANLQLVGMVSEGDLIGRSDADRVARRDWWLTLLKDAQPQTETFAALAARPVEQVMRAPVLTIEARAPLHEIAEMLKVYDIKRLPVMQGDRMVGIVSRSDLVRAVATQIPKPPMKESIGGLLSLFTGMMQTDVRPEDAPASAPPVAAERLPVTAGSFRELVTIAEQVVRDDVVAAKQLAALGRLRQIKAMLLEHLDKQVWAELLDRAQASAAQGGNSFELIRFPCDLCSDGGRKIDVAEIDWPTTLRGEAAEVYARWERELRPAGFRLRAQIVEYLDGIPNNIALSLAWAAPESSELKQGS